MSVVETAAKIIGMEEGGDFPSTSWLHDPFTPLTTILTNDEQRQALLDLLDQLWPAQIPAGVAANEKWHPILGPQADGNLYFTIANGTGPLTLGLAGERHTSGGGVGASLRARVPVVRIDGDAVTFVAGSSDGPLQLDLRVELNWSAAGGHAIGLQAIHATASLQPRSTPPANLTIVLEGLSLNGASPADTVLDAAKLDSQALQLVMGLLQEELQQLTSGGLSGGLAALAKDLMPLMGLDGDIPALPILAIAQDPDAFRDWLSAVVSAGKVTDWLGHLGSLFGGTSAASGSGTASDPWLIPIFTIDANSSVALSVAQSTEPHSGVRSLDLGIRAAYKSTDPSLQATIQADAVIASVALSGPVSAKALPSASVMVVVSAAPVATTIRGGAVWNGSNIVPLLELDDVTLTIDGSTAHYDRIDLTNTDSVVSAAASAVETLLGSAIGNTGAGAHLLALVGLAKPASDPGWTHPVDLPTLVSNPPKAIAAVHRAALLDPAHSWSALWAEIAGLTGLGGAATG